MQNKHEMTTGTLLVRLFQVMKHLVGYIVLAVLFAVLGFVTTVAIPSLLVLLVFQAVRGQDLSLIWLFVLILLAFLRGGFRYGEHFFGHYVAFHSLADLRKIIFTKLRALTPAKLDRQDSGALLKMISEDIEALEIFYAHTVAPVCTGILTACLMFVYFAQFSWLLSLLTLLIYLTLALVIPLQFAKQLEKLLPLQNQERKAYVSYFLESLNAMEDLKQFGRVEERFTNLNERSKEVNGLERKVAQVQFLQQSATFTTIGLGICLVATFLAMQLNGASLTLETATLAFVAFVSSFAPFLELGRLPLGFKRAMNAGRHLFALLDEEEPLASGEKKAVALDEISFDNLTFAYSENDHPIFEQFSSDFRGKKVIGLVGESGSGKSTLMKLLMRWYDSQQGSVLLTGVDHRTIEPSHLQGSFAYVPQLAQIFHKSVRENFVLSRKDISDQEIWELAKKCRMDERLKQLPQGLDTVVDQEHYFSAGEKQRLELMRALLKKADVYIFDEPTSHLDSLNEAAFLSIVKEECQGLVFLVTHRLSSLAFVDEMYELSHSKLRRIK